ncbi:MAG: isochorismatase family protein [Ignavibacteriales bacterium]|nr:MAG: isochorismatase family protein [Ignavibacteriales bacterium]
MKKLLILSLLLMVNVLTTQAQEAIKDQEMKPALLVIDIQNSFLEYMSDEKKLAMEMINAAIYTFRQMKLPIIRVYHTNPGWGPAPGTEAFEYPKSVAILDEDPKVIKNYPSAFIKTDLDKILKEKGCNTLFLCGLSATGCVLATYHGGLEREYKPFMIKEAIISNNAQYTNVIKDICASVDFDTMTFMLEKLNKK